jgi:ATP/maltotriose-dependent transcriptional regulator MalT
MQLMEKISQAIPTNKFQPPRLTEAQLLQRYTLLEGKYNQSSPPKVIYMEGQAGQGKTTLALQWLTHNKSHYCWYQVGIEDQDPILCLSAILVMLCEALPSFSAPLLVKRLEHGEAGLHDLPGCVEDLNHDLASFLQHEIFIVFDDLHLLEKAPVTLSMLDHLLNTAPPQVRFLMASRRPVPLNAVTSGQPAVLILGNKQLALNCFEAFEFVHDIMHVSVSWPMLEKIHQRTAGWFMGLILAGHSLEAGNEQLAAPGIGPTGDYFRREILAQLPQDLHVPLACLSFLDEIEIPLARQVTGVKDIDDRLMMLMAQNYFVRALDSDNQVFVLHHFFQDFLQQLGREKLDPQTIIEVLTRAAAYSLEKGRLEQGLSYYVKAGCFREIEDLLRREGMELLARNRNVTLCVILNAIPAEVVADSAWLSLYLGLARLDPEPEATFPFLAKAMALFIEQDEPVGELLAGAQILYSHFIFTALYEEDGRILPRMQTLFEEVADQLPLFARILVAKNIAMGAISMAGDVKLSRRFTEIALELSQRHRIYNFTAATLLSRGFEHLLAGEYKAAVATAEHAYEFIHHKHVSLVNRLALTTFLLNLVDCLGNSHGYRAQKASMLREIGAGFINQTLIGSSLLVWDAGLAVAAGHLDKAREFLHQAGEHGATAHNPHMHSQFLHWQAYVAALEGNETEAVKAADESMRLRKSAGSPFYVILNRLILGAAYCLIGRWTEAEALLEECGILCRKHHALVMLCASHLYKAYLQLNKGGAAAALDDLTLGLSLMRQHGWVYFLSWSPQIMKPLLQTAVRERIEVDYARKLARERFSMMILDDGAMIPLLSVQILGGFAIELEGKVICHSDNLSPTHRQILSMLFSNRGRCLNLEALQLALWPDSPPRKARSNMDSHISRLRKFLGDRCSPHDIKNYLVVANGMLILQNYQIDALEFIELAAKGLAKSRENLWWQANNHFTAAMSLWPQGGIGSELPWSSETYGFSLQLNNLLAQSAIAWSSHLRKTGRLHQAVQVVEHAWSNDFASIELVKVLFALHLHNKDLAQARNLVWQYAEVLRRDDYAEEEIEELCSEIRASQSFHKEI